MTLIGSLRRLFTRRDKQFVGLLLLLSIVVSLFETVGISALMFFITVATNFEMIAKNIYFKQAYDFFHFTHPAYFISCLGIGLIAFYMVRAFLNLALVYSLNNFAQMRQHRFSTEIFERFLLLDYKDFVQRNSATFAQVIFTYSGNATQVINGALNILSESFTILAIYAMLFYVNWKMTLVLSVLLAVKVFIIVKTFSRRITTAGKRSQEFAVKMSRIFSETFSNYKFFKLLGDIEDTASHFRKLNHQFARTNNVNAVWQGLPRFILETMGFTILISVIVYVLFVHRNAQFVIPIVSMYALAFYRFLPSVNKILTGYNQIIFNKHALEPLERYMHLNYEKLGAEKVTFDTSLKLKDVSISYSAGKPILQQISLSISPGEKIGFIGESGAGKTTLVDVLIGLLKPNSGDLIIDDKKIEGSCLSAWRHMIGYIPQTIYLFDGTVAENVLFGRPRDEERLINVLKQANIYDFLLEKGGVETRVGEAGIQLSGGQRQRVAIARALYGNPPVLVLDEATSSLDNENEERIMEEVYDSSAGRTMLIIAHRLTTIARCDRVFRVEGGRVVEVEVPRLHSPAITPAQYA